MAVGKLLRRRLVSQLRHQSEAVPDFIHPLLNRLIHRNRRAPLAGYVLDAKGRRVVAIMLINHGNAHNAGAVQDALLRWVHGR